MLAKATERDERVDLVERLAELLRDEDAPTAVPEPSIDERTGEPPVFVKWPAVLSAAIFDRTGRATMALSIYGLPSQFGERETQRYRRDLLAATDRVTAAIGGVRPDTSALS